MDSGHNTKSLCTCNAPFLPETKKEPYENRTTLLFLA